MAGAVEGDPHSSTSTASADTGVAVLLLVPGFTLYTGMLAIVQGDTSAAVSRLGDAGIISLAIAVGVAIGLGVGTWVRSATSNQCPANWRLNRRCSGRGGCTSPPGSKCSLVAGDSLSDDKIGVLIAMWNDANMNPSASKQTASLSPSRVDVDAPVAPADDTA